MWRIFILFCILFSTSKAHDIICEFKNQAFDDFGTLYQCYAKNDLKIDSPSNENITNVTGIHLNLKSLIDVESFLVYRKNVQYFPRNLKEFFINLEAIGIDDCKLKEIHQNDLKPFLNLRALFLINNELENLEENLFLYNPDLEVIYLYANKIKNIHSSVFEQVKFLNTLDLSQNLCVNAKVINEREKVVNFVEKIKITCMTLEDFKEQRKMVEKCKEDAEDFIEIDCSVQSFKYATYKPLIPVCRTLNSSLRISNPNTIIYRVNLDINKDILEPRGFSSAFNIFNFLPTNFDIFPNLEILEINNGSVKEIHQENFRKLKKLTYLDLSYNDIETLDFGTFDFNTKLRLIWLNYNKLKSVSVESLKKLKFLENLDLRPCHGIHIKSASEIPSELKIIALNCIYSSDDEIKTKNHQMSLRINDIECRKKIMDEKFNTIMKSKSIDGILSENPDEQIDKFDDEKNCNKTIVEYLEEIENLERKLGNFENINELNCHAGNPKSDVLENPNDKILLICVILIFCLIFLSIIIASICCYLKHKNVPESETIETFKGVTMNNDVYGAEYEVEIRNNEYSEVIHPVNHQVNRIETLDQKNIQNCIENEIYGVNNNQYENIPNSLRLNSTINYETEIYDYPVVVYEKCDDED